MKFVVVPVNPNTPVVLLYVRYDHTVESDVRFILLLNVVQSVPVRRPVEVVLAFPIDIVTFGHTVAPVPLVTKMAELREEIFPNVRADCFELNVVQSVFDSAPFCNAEASVRESTCPERESPFAVPSVTAA
jgi:hypothetical protein